jgi:hypothetical protein
MKKVIMSVMLTAVFALSATVLYAGNGNLIVDGNLGVGTTTPPDKLDVIGSISVWNSSRQSIFYANSPAITSNSNNYFVGLDANNCTCNIASGLTDSGWRIGLEADGFIEDPNFEGTLAYQAGVLVLHGSYNSAGAITNSYGVFINSLGNDATTITNLYGLYQAASIAKNYFAGNVGIGTTSPSYNLHVNGSAWVTSGAWTGSDIRWKKDIVPLEGSLEKVTKLQGVSYRWRTEEFPEQRFSEDKQIGLVAQETEKVVPEIVTTNNEGYKGISYEKLCPLLVEAIKELKADNEKTVRALKADNDKFVQELKAENGNLRREVEQLKAMVEQPAGGDRYSSAQ